MISYDGGNYVGNPAYLIVKDGGGTPTWYLYDLTALLWDGMDEIKLINFWSDGYDGPIDVTGEISNITIYGTPVPEPATILLLGSGLIGLAGFRRNSSLKSPISIAHEDRNIVIILVCNSQVESIVTIEITGGCRDWPNSRVIIQYRLK